MPECQAFADGDELIDGGVGSGVGSPVRARHAYPTLVPCTLEQQKRAEIPVNAGYAAGIFGSRVA
ncbi:hypothetical protein MMC22_000411 [Lobaria immixta]|nr:hypothetical protein [Lobaria immixta]